MNTQIRTLWRSRRFFPASSLLGRILLLALASEQQARADVVSNFLTKVVGLISGAWGIGVVVLATAYVGYSYFFTDRHDNGHIGRWLIGCMFVLGCQVVANQFITP